MFLIGVGFAFNAPAWTSIVPQVVSEIELPSAATLSGLQFNISGIIGPALGGLLVPLAGANCVFARIKISRAQMLASGRSSPSMVGMSSETVG